MATTTKATEPATKPAPTLKLAAYASTGGRKTLQIGHLIESFGPENVFILNCEQGLGTIASRLNGVATYDIGSSGGKETEGLSPADKFRKAWDWVKKNDGEGRWLCVDGGTRVLQWLQDQIWGGTAAAYNEIVSGTRRTDLTPAIRPYGRFITDRLDINSQAQWVELGMAAQRVFNSYVTLKSNLYWTFWEEKTSVGQYEKSLPYTIDTPGNNARLAIQGAFDFIFRLTPDGKSGCTAAFQNGNLQYAKVRDDWNAGLRVPATVPGFNLATFARFLRGEGALPEPPK